MPLARYFLFIGAVLLALLFVVDACLPQMPTAERTNATVDRSVIRIHSDRKWPERVVLDTTRPTITPARTTANVPAPTSVAEPVRVRDAFAQLTPSSSTQLQPADPRKSEPKPLRKRKTVARVYTGPPPILVAQQPRFGFFGSSIW